MTLRPSVGVCVCFPLTRFTSTLCCSLLCPSIAHQKKRAASIHPPLNPSTTIRNRRKLCFTRFLRPSAPRLPPPPAVLCPFLCPFCLRPPGITHTTRSHTSPRDHTHPDQGRPLVPINRRQSFLDTLLSSTDEAQPPPANSRCLFVIPVIHSPGTHASLPSFFPSPR